MKTIERAHLLLPALVNYRISLYNDGIMQDFALHVHMHIDIVPVLFMPSFLRETGVYPRFLLSWILQSLLALFSDAL